MHIYKKLSTILHSIHLIYLILNHIIALALSLTPISKPDHTSLTTKSDLVPTYSLVFVLFCSPPPPHYKSSVTWCQRVQCQVSTTQLIFDWIYMSENKSSEGPDKTEFLVKWVSNIVFCKSNQLLDFSPQTNTTITFNNTNICAKLIFQSKLALKALILKVVLNCMRGECINVCFVK